MTTCAGLAAGALPQGRKSAAAAVEKVLDGARSDHAERTLGGLEVRPSGQPDQRVAREPRHGEPFALGRRRIGRDQAGVARTRETRRGAALVPAPKKIRAAVRAEREPLD